VALLPSLSLPAGHNTTAAEIAQIIQAINDLSAYVVKTADETVTSSATVQDDDELFMTLGVANAVYEMTAGIIYGASAAAGTNGFKYTFTGPAGAVMNWVPHVKIDTDGTNAATSIWQTSLSLTQTVSAGGAGAVGTTMTAAPKGILTVGATTGTLKLRWSQATSNATGTKVYAGSYLALRRLA
jgi:hypothetical protein